MRQAIGYFTHLNSSTTTSSGVEVIVSGTGALRVDPAEIARSPAVKEQLATLRKLGDAKILVSGRG